ncbi:MAG: peptidoglycan DD-metalloendopeptidase family protein [Eubacterium sp.]|jgi:murein DD-endopeptidase MepM/ murein hydrolase activator NlpD|nr:peptidoglycan DD-metalloendopeptidase family protein [Eubacterium sp.]MCH4046467.1 peptidoglycan DD-metalloendopeptidase family protein [Eubacterium sp.]MCH4079562.1 peptidoglycan DD-metalloendopeptidase family protein [Eubacterium sp.]MCH4111142.1 peptidoglycan DD-metalloendopeptidase family protein [Eubacterium sp.]MCI1307354.1 peptidoglycan DD-metalloendopeptidase family protein [Eubacterium sp.]
MKADIHGVLKKTAAAAVAAALVLTFIPAQTSSYASSLGSVRSKKADVYSQMNKTAAKIEKQEKSIKKLQKQIEKKEAAYQKSQKEMEAAKAKMADRKEKLGLRVRAMYKTGAVGYMDIILNSKSFSEVVSNTEMVKKIYTSDQNALDEIKVQKQELSDRQDSLKKQKSELENKQTELEKQQKEMKSEESQLKAQYSRLKAKESRMEKKLEAKLAAAGSSSSDSSYVSGDGSLAWPCTGTITTEFGTKRSWDPYSTAHTGMDIGVSYGTAIHAAASGTVIIAGSYGGYGNCVAISHGNGLVTLYGHNSSLTVSVGDKVKKGDVIAKAGSTGFSTGVHCHFEVQKNGTPVNPRKYLS